MARADRITVTSQKRVRYADFASSFGLSPVTGDLALVTDTEAVKQSVRNLILTHRGERFFQPTLGCLVHDLLFEPSDGVTLGLIHTTIEQAIQAHEPRAQLVSVDAQATPDETGVQVTVTFGVVNLPEPVTLKVFLKRAR